MAKATKKAEDAVNVEQADGQPKETVQEKTPAAEEKPQDSPMIYVGPPVKGTILHSTFTIFADGIPEEYKQHPTFKHLFVPPARLDQARREIGKTGSLRNTYYKRAVEGQRQAAASRGAADTSPSLGVETTKKASDK